MASLDTINVAKGSLWEESKNVVVLSRAKTPIFQGISDQKLRALMCLIAGCNVYLIGALGIQMKTLPDVSNQFKPSKWYCDKASLHNMFATWQQNVD